jgi:antitoxin HicB
MANNPYAIVIVALADEDGGGFLGFAPDLKGCMSDGATSVEALHNTEQAVLEWLDAARESGQDIPAPGCAHESAVKAQGALLQKIAEQTRALEQFDTEIRTLREALNTLTDRISENKPTWHIDPMPLIAARAMKETAVH